MRNYSRNFLCIRLLFQLQHIALESQAALLAHKSISLSEVLCFKTLEVQFWGYFKSLTGIED